MNSRHPIRSTIRTHAGEAESEAETLKRDFREALSYWASGVAVLAVSDGDEVEAITVSAFASVSVDPPLVLACVANQSAILPTLLDQRRFTVSLLAEDAQRAASAVAQRLPLDELRFAAEGDPVLEGAPVSLVCRLHAEHPGGDHRILVGEVERVELGRDAPPLLYFRRGYARLQGTRR